MTLEGGKRLGWVPGEPVALHTPRLLIRSLGPADVDDAYVAWYGDPEVMLLTAQPMHATRAQILETIARADQRQLFMLGLFDRMSGGIIGFSRLTIDDWTVVGYTTTVIGERSYWGRGLGFEARGALIDFLFAEAGVRKILALTYGRNARSIGLSRKLGFSVEATLRSQEQIRDGSWQDVVWLGLFGAEWRAWRAARGITAPLYAAVG